MVCPNSVAEFFEHRAGQWRRSGDKQAHERSDLARAVRVEIEQPHVHGGHAEEESRSEIEKYILYRLVHEPLEQPHAASAREPAMSAVA